MQSSTDNIARPRIPERVQAEIRTIALQRGVSTTAVLREALTRGLLSLQGFPVLPALQPGQTLP